MSRQHPLKQTKKLELPLHPLYLVVAVLLLAVLGTSMWTTTVMAKYVTSTTGSDKARVARFDVTAEPMDDPAPGFYLALPDTGLEDTDVSTEWEDCTERAASYSFTVTSSSEVTVTYDVVIKFTEELSKDVTLTLKKDGKSVDGQVSTDGKTAVFSSVGTFNAGETQSDDWTLTFTVNEGAETGGSWKNIEIEVYAAQVNGKGAAA